MAALHPVASYRRNPTVEVGSFIPLFTGFLHIPGGYFGILSINIMSVCHIYHRFVMVVTITMTSFGTKI